MGKSPPQKRDGTCLAVWLEEEPRGWLDRILRKPARKALRISTRHQKEASKEFQNAFRAAKSESFGSTVSLGVEALLTENPNYIVFGELLLKV